MSGTSRVIHMALGVEVPWRQEFEPLQTLAFWWILHSNSRPDLSIYPFLHFSSFISSHYSSIVHIFGWSSALYLLQIIPHIILYTILATGYFTLCTHVPPTSHLQLAGDRYRTFLSPMIQLDSFFSSSVCPPFSSPSLFSSSTTNINRDIFSIASSFPFQSPCLLAVCFWIVLAHPARPRRLLAH